MSDDTQIDGGAIYSSGAAELYEERDRLRALLRRWVEWLPNSIWECRACGHIASPKLEGMSHYTRSLVGDTLREVEWSGVRKEDGETICPTCLWLKDDGHAPDCALDAALRDKEATNDNATE